MLRKLIISLITVLAIVLACNYSLSVALTEPYETFLGDYIAGASGGFSRYWLAYIIEPETDAGDQSLYVDLNGQRLGPYSDVDYYFQFSEDEKHIAFAAQKDNQWYVVLDGVEKWAYPELKYAYYSWAPDLEEQSYMPDNSSAALKFSPSGDRLAYKVITGDAQQAVYVNDQPGPVFTSLSLPIWFVSGDYLYWGKDSQDAVYYIYGDRKFGPYDEVWDAKISSDEGHYVFAARKGAEYFLVADGKEQALSGKIITFAIGPSGETAYAIQSGTGEKVFFNGDKWPGQYDIITELTISPDGRHLAYWGKRGDSWFVIRDKTVVNLGFGGLYYYESNGEHYGILWDAASQNIAYFTSGDLSNATLALNGKLKPAFHFSRSPLTYYTDNSGNYMGEEDVFGLSIDRQALVEYLLEGTASPDDPCSVRLVNGKLAYIQTRYGQAYVVIGKKNEGPYTGVGSNLAVSSDGMHYAYVIETGNSRQLVLDGESTDWTYENIYRVRFTSDQSVDFFGVKDGKVYSVEYPLSIDNKPSEGTFGNLWK